MNSRSKCLSAALLLSGATLLTLSAYGSKAKGQQNPPLITLQAFEDVIETRGSASYISSSDDDKTLYVLDGQSGDVETFSSEADGKYRPRGQAHAAVRGPRGTSAKAEDGSKVAILDAAGKVSARFPTYPASSLAFLSNGNLVVASPTKAGVLHVYGPTGKLLKSFGPLKGFDKKNAAQNLFLHRGKVLVDAADNVYYVYHYVPLIQKYSPGGALVYGRTVEGEAIDIQGELVQRFLGNMEPQQTGGIDLINSAAVDRKTGHLWLAMNGSTTSGIVYEYNPRGEKLREYALRPGPASVTNLSAAKDIVVVGSRIHVLSQQHQVFSFDKNGVGPVLPKSVSKSEELRLVPALLKVGGGRFAALAPQIAGCPTAQDWSTCNFTCPGPACNGDTPTTTSSTGGFRDCKAVLAATLTTGYSVVSSNCTQWAAGTTGHLRGGCKSDVTICREGNVQTSHSATIDCPAPSCQTSSNSCPNTSPLLIGWCTDWNYFTCTCDGYIEKSPVLIDVLGDGFDLTDAAGGVNFDLDSNGVAERLSWTAAGSDDAWLALDHDSNGLIEYGTELFGNYTTQPASATPNGFAALAEFDKAAKGGNDDGSIDAEDSVFASLRLWQDTNHDGVSQPTELRTLASLNLESISLAYRESKRRDRHGNVFRYRAKVYGPNHNSLGRWAYDVFLVAGN